VRGGTRRRALGAAAVAAVAGFALSGCADPQYRFVTSSEKDVVVRVPWDWSRIARDDVLRARPGATAAPSEEESQVPEGTWIAYYDGAAHPEPAHVLADNVAAPIVLLQSSAIAAESRDSISVDQLKDLYRPVSEEARAQRAALLQANGLPEPAFRLITDQPIRTKDAVGVHVVYSYGSGAQEEVYDQVAEMDAKRTRWHVVIVHCRASCWTAHRQEIEAVADSFTVKKP